MSHRFTIDGSIELERHLEKVCAQVRDKVTKLIPAGKLEAIFLGGGYGRGEGGVLQTVQGDRPYNDLEFYICVQGNPRLNERSLGAPLHALGEELSEHAGIEVEFKITSLNTFKRSPTSMFLYDLAMGHRTLLGSDEVLRAQKFQDSSQIPLHEATRLLMNRCSGLLYAEEKLTHRPFTPEDADFVARNQAKAQLAFGDIVLTAFGQYHWSCKERNRRLQKLASEIPVADFPVSLSKIACHHSLGVEFKLHPKQSRGSVEDLTPLQSELREIGMSLWLWLESRRLQTRFSTVRDYSFGTINKCPETRSFKNRLINLKHFGPNQLLGTKGSRYPRERLLHALPLLLWGSTVGERMKNLGRIQEELNTVSTDSRGLINAYSSLWRKFN